MFTAPSPYLPIGSQVAVTSLSGVQVFTIPHYCAGILIQAFTQNVRLTMDGTTPTSTVGFQLKAGDPAVFIPAPPNTVLRFIEETASANIIYQPVRFYNGIG